MPRVPPIQRWAKLFHVWMCPPLFCALQLPCNYTSTHVFAMHIIASNSVTGNVIASFPSLFHKKSKNYFHKRWWIEHSANELILSLPQYTYRPNIYNQLWFRVHRLLNRLIISPKQSSLAHHEYWFMDWTKYFLKIPAILITELFQLLTNIPRK